MAQYTLSNRTIKIFADAVAIQARLLELGFKSVIAGGFARDTFFGLEPKDCDIVVYGDNTDKLEEALNLGVWDRTGDSFFARKVSGPLRLEDPLFQGGTWCDMYGTMNQDAEASDRIIGVMQLPHKNIDVIVYTDCDEAQDVIDNFDFNINQFAMYQDLAAGTTYPLYFGDTSLKQLALVRNDASQQRQIKVANKYNALRHAIELAYKENRLCD